MRVLFGDQEGISWCKRYCTSALTVDHWPWDQTCAVRCPSAKLACRDIMGGHALQNICSRSVGGLRRFTASSLLVQDQSQQQQRQSTYLGKSVMHSAVGNPRGHCTQADDTLPEARKVLHFWYTCKHCLEAPSIPFCLSRYQSLPCLQAR